MATKECPHGIEFLIKIDTEEYKYTYCTRCMEAITDLHNLPYEQYYEKYPELKPIYPPAKVTLDEVDKRR